MTESRELDEELAKLLRGNLLEIAHNVIASFDRCYPDSPMCSLPRDERLRWAQLEIERLIGVLLTGRLSGRGIPYQPNITGIAGSSAKFISAAEGSLFLEEGCLPVVWRHFETDTGRLYRAATLLKRCVHQYTVEIMAVLGQDESERADEGQLAIDEHRRRVTWELQRVFLAALAPLKTKTSAARDLIASRRVEEALVALSELKLIEVDMADTILSVGGDEQDTGAPQPTLKIRPHEDAGAASLTSPRQSARAADTLSDRERQVLALIAAGATNVEISQALSITISTVKNHLSSIQDKLNLKNRTQMAAFAARHGYSGDEWRTNAS